MAAPRVFVSSTCYDLQEVRYQLRTFIEDFGFIPVMSEYGDIFYDYKKHTQDACKDEIEKSQLFILIIGNNYGSFYYDNKSNTLPDSVTMQEFKKALNVNIKKHIFINKFVDHDYNNFKRLRTEYIESSLKKISAEGSDIKDIAEKENKKFSESYQYPQKSYKYIFHFLDIIYDLKTNNSKEVYETFQEIRESLKKQWAGFVYDSIYKEYIVSSTEIEKLCEQVSKLENQIKLLIDSKTETKNGSMTFDVKVLAQELNLQEIKEIKSKIEKYISDIFYVTNNFGDQQSRVSIIKGTSCEDINKWIDSLKDIVIKYKWSNFISIDTVFSVLNSKYVIEISEDIPYDSVLNSWNVCNKVKSLFSEEDYNSFVNNITDILNNIYSITVYNPPAFSSDIDDLPF